MPEQYYFFLTCLIEFTVKTPGADVLFLGKFQLWLQLFNSFGTGRFFYFFCGKSYFSRNVFISSRFQIIGSKVITVSDYLSNLCSTSGKFPLISSVVYICLLSYFLTQQAREVGWFLYFFSKTRLIGSCCFSSIVFMSLLLAFIYISFLRFLLFFF